MDNDGNLVIDVTNTDEPELDLGTTPETADKVVDLAPSTPAAEPKPAAVETPKIEGIEELRAQLENARKAQDVERAARAAAEAREHQATQRVSQAHTEVIDSHLAAIDSSLQAENTKLNSAKQEYKIAWEAGDSGALAEAADKIAASRAVLLRLDEGKADLEARKAAPTREPAQREAARPVQQADPFEAAIANISPRTQAWLRTHPECVNDEKMNKKANAAHNMALAEGYVVESDAYFDYCERFLGYKTDDAEPQPQPKPRATPAQRTRPMAAAPVRNGSTQTNGNLGEGQVVLSKGEQEAATDGTLVWNYDDPKGKFKKGDAIGLREMARRKLIMGKQGAYDRSPTGT